MWSLVFLSQPPSADIADAAAGDGEHVSVFMPCTPNPTTGFFFFVPRKDVIELDITVEDAMTLLISAGMVQPGADKDAQKKLAAHRRDRARERSIRESRRGGRSVSPPRMQP